MVTFPSVENSCQRLWKRKTFSLPTVIDKHFARIVSPKSNFQIEMDSAYMPFEGRYKHFVVGVDAFSRNISAKQVTGLKAPAMNRAVIE